MNNIHTHTHTHTHDIDLKKLRSELEVFGQDLGEMTIERTTTLLRDSLAGAS